MILHLSFVLSWRSTSVFKMCVCHKGVVETGVLTQELDLPLHLFFNKASMPNNSLGGSFKFEQTSFLHSLHITMFAEQLSKNPSPKYLLPTFFTFSAVLPISNIE